MSGLLNSGRSWSGHERHCCFLNIGGERFSNVASVLGFDLADDGRALAATDWDHDGDLDLWITNRTRPRVRYLRNDQSAGHHFVAVRLTGSDCNRDAIGARVDVILADPSSPPLTRGLRAGEGFLGQSSKWLHFGLGDARSIERMVVRWPDGQVEEYSNLEVDRKYQIVQGAGGVQAWTGPPPPTSAHEDEPSNDPTRPAEQFRVALSWPIPLPPLHYETPDGRRVPIDARRGSPLLLNLYSRHCVPCVAELTEMSREADRLRATGLEVLALSVDHLSAEPQPTDDDGPESLLEEIGFPFLSGRATGSLVDKLEIIDAETFDRTQPFPVPTSFLIDARGALAAIYKGPVTVAALLADRKDLENAPEPTRVMNDAWEGRWLAGPGGPFLAAMAQDLIKAGFINDAIEFVARNQPSIATDPGYVAVLAKLGDVRFAEGRFSDAEPWYREAASQDDARAEAFVQWGRALLALHRYQEAEHAYRQAAQRNPRHARIRMNVGVALQHQGRLQDAERELREAVRLDAESSSVRMNLGVVLFALHRAEEARRELQVAVRLDEDNVRARTNLGAVLGQLGETKAAEAQFREALRIDNTDSDSRFNLAVILIQRQQLEEARTQLTQLLEDDPQHVDGRIRLALLHERQQQYGSAEEAYRTVLRLRPDHVLAMTRLARLLGTDVGSGAGDRAEAVRWAEKANEATQRRSAEVMATLAEVYAASGRRKNAIASAEDAIKLADAKGEARVKQRLEALLKRLRGEAVD